MATQAILTTVTQLNAKHTRIPRSKLSTKQRCFLTAYLEHGNATHAAIAAGYSEKRAGSAGSYLLKNPHIQAAIELELEKRGLTATYVLSAIRSIADDEHTRNADKLTALTLLGKHLRLFAEQLDVNVTHDLADRVAQARQRMSDTDGIRAALPHQCED